MFNNSQKSHAPKEARTIPEISLEKKATPKKETSKASKHFFLFWGGKLLIGIKSDSVGSHPSPLKLFTEATKTVQSG